MRKLLVVLAAVAFVAAFTAPAFAAEWSFYGHARLTTFWIDEDFGDWSLLNGEDDDMDLNHSLQGNSRIGANVKLSDNLTGRFEYGTGINLRILWGEYDFGGFKLGVGQHYTPVNIFISNQVTPYLGGGDDNLLPYGGVYNGRRAMVRATFGGFQIALVEVPDITVAQGPYSIPGEIAHTYETDVTLPMIQAKYSFNVGGLGVQLAGAYSTYESVGPSIPPGDNDEDIDSYIGAIGLTYNAGPFTLGGNYWMGQNVGNLGMWNLGVDEAIYDTTGDEILDNDGWGFILVGGFAANENLRFEAGYAQSEFEVDDIDDEDETASYYVQAKITFAKGVFIVPEVGVIDRGDDLLGLDEGDATYYGLQWQIRF
jgi:hypothetical protein